VPDARRIGVAPGVELHVLTDNDAGSQPPVLLVHGLASNARMWDGVAADLSGADHPVAAVDLRGHGRSDKPGDGYDFGTVTDDLLSLIGALGWSAPWVAGQSWGANVVLELAARYPEATAGLVLVDGGTIELVNRFADWPTAEAALAPPHLEGTDARAIERMLRGGHPDWPESGITGSMANFEILTDGTVRPWLSRDRHMAIVRHLWDHRPSTRYRLVHVPVVLVPAEDPSNQRWMAGKRDDVARAAKELERSVTRWIPGDHDLHAEHPMEVARLIHDATGPDFFP
jgi:pimeloyl-ACP methyl ester carboxylesterase